MHLLGSDEDGQLSYHLVLGRNGIVRTRLGTCLPLIAGHQQGDEAREECQHEQSSQGLSLL